jgi:hypothetical protein
MALDQDDIESEVLAGLPNEKDRLQDAYDQLRFSMACFDEYPTRTKDGRWKSGSTRRTSRVFARVVDILCRNLYKAQPTRKLADPEAGEALARAYKRNAMGPKWKRADELTLITGFCAWKFEGTEDPANPLKVSLWGGDEITYWADPDDPMDPIAVGVLDTYDNRRRCRLYTREEIVSYATSKGYNHPAWGGTAYKEVGRKANPYRTPEGEGILPFSFCHWHFPTQRFTTDGPGPGLRELNEHVNERLDRLGDAIFYLGRPVGIATGVDPAWTPPTEIKPGDFVVLPNNEDVGGNGAPPTLAYLLPELQFVSADWADLNFYLDHTLEMHGVPPVLIRMIQSGARSGVSLQSEQLPLLTWVEGRRAEWAAYEDRAAFKSVQVAAAHLAANGLISEAAGLWAPLEDWQFTLRWPQLFVQLPGPERDREDDNRIAKGFASKVMILQERQDLTEAEALELMAKVKAQNDQLAAMGIDPMAGVNAGNPFAAGATAPMGAEPDGQDEESPAGEGEGE